MHDEQEPLHEGRPDPLPEPLRNWQVLEIDSQATPVIEPDDELDDAPESPPGAAPHPAGAPAHQPPTSRPEDLRDLQIADRPDDVIVATLDNRRRQVECGGTVEYAVSVLNNGGQTATFQVQIEGWIDPQWLGDTAAAVTLEGGRRATLRLSIAPPRRAESEAGDYHFAVIVRSPEYPGRTARLGALLTVLPFDAAEVRFLELPDVAVSWLRRSAALPISVANRGNRPAAITLRGANSPSECRFAFAVPTDNAGQPGLTLQPNQAVTFPVRVEVQRPPLLGLHGRELIVQVEGRISDQFVAATRTALLARPLIGPWQMAAATGVAAAGAVGLLLVLALVFLLAQRGVVQPTTGAAPAPAAAAPPPVIIVTLNQPASAAATGAQNASPAAAANFSTGASPDPGLPLVLPDQVSAPSGAGAQVAPAVASAAGAAAGSAAAPARPAAAASGASASLTYGQMFQEVGSRFDLDWRMLAAQAYVESGFDSLALSDSGAMGLMQVLPNTWREWAPAAEVSDPFDAYSSVLVAGAYLDYLRRGLAADGRPETEWMLIAYNWGPDQLNDFLAGGGTWETLPEMRRQYASEILRIAKSIP